MGIPVFECTECRHIGIRPVGVPVSKEQPMVLVPGCNRCGSPNIVFFTRNEIENRKKAIYATQLRLAL